jgi:hypothetical protein
MNTTKQPAQLEALDEKLASAPVIICFTVFDNVL